jgi:hypothetical protein
MDMGIMSNHIANATKPSNTPIARKNFLDEITNDCTKTTNTKISVAYRVCPTRFTSRSRVYGYLVYDSDFGVGDVHPLG